MCVYVCVCMCVYVYVCVCMYVCVIYSIYLSAQRSSDPADDHNDSSRLPPQLPSRHCPPTTIHCLEHRILQGGKGEWSALGTEGEKERHTLNLIFGASGTP